MQRMLRLLHSSMLEKALVTNRETARLTSCFICNDKNPAREVARRNWKARLTQMILKL